MPLQSVTVTRGLDGEERWRDACALIVVCGETSARRGCRARRAMPIHAPDCHLCARALAIVRDAQAELGFELELVDIDGDPELEAHYREYLPVMEIDGTRAFTYFVEPGALCARLRALS